MTDEPRACRHCGEPLRDVSEPQMGGVRVERWVHDYGGYSICFPQNAARSPRAEPLEQKQPLVAITIRTRKPGKWRFVDTAPPVLPPLWCEPCPGHEDMGEPWTELEVHPVDLDSTWRRDNIEQAATYGFRVPRAARYRTRLTLHVSKKPNAYLYRVLVTAH